MTKKTRLEMKYEEDCQHWDNVEGRMTTLVNSKANNT